MWNVLYLFPAAIDEADCLFQWKKKNVKKPEKLIEREINNVSYINFWNNKYSCDLFLPELCQFFARKLGSFICLFVYLFIYLFI